MPCQEIEQPETIDQCDVIPVTGETQPVRKPSPWTRRARIAGWSVLGVFGLAFVSFLVFYIRLAGKIDRRLAQGPFSTSADILAAPRTIAVGEPMTQDEAVQSLRQSGYTRTRDNPEGWFAEHRGTLDIFPGEDSAEGGGPVRVTFANGHIAGIFSQASHAAVPEYTLDPQLMVNLSENREKRRLVRFADIPPSLVQAVTSAEDKHFFRHGGFDFPRMLKAAYIDLKDGRKQQGASTLTMQLARGLWLDPGKRWRRKFEETLITMHLEHRLTKQQIFEDYANQVYMGTRNTFSINGFAEASRTFFDKDLSQINTAEAALLAGLIQRPSYYNPVLYPERARDRRNVVLEAMFRNHYLSESAYRNAAASPVKTAPEPAGETGSSYFIALLDNEMREKFEGDDGPSRRVYTTLDPDLQEAAQIAVRAGMEKVDEQLRTQNPKGAASAPPQVALIALDPRTGEIKALVGGRDFGGSQLNRVMAMRQPGSVFKPFVYAAALSTAVAGGSRIFTPASMLNDVATTFYAGGRAYQPKDFHGDFMGDVSLRTALAHSLNVATVSLAQQVGYQQVVDMARRAGLNDNIRATPAVALGAYEATPLQIAAAYTMFANHGVRVSPTTIASVRSREGEIVYRHEPDTRAVLDPRVAYLMVNMMQEVLRSGTGAAVRWRGFLQPAAGKTGTSRDGWFAGFTSELLCVVWVGFDDNRDLNLEGARSALPIWAEFMKRAAQFPPYSSAHEFQRPEGVISVNICSDTGELAGANCPNVHPEVFVSGTEPGVECKLHNPQPDRDIASAPNQTVSAQPVILR